MNNPTVLVGVTQAFLNKVQAIRKNLQGSAGMYFAEDSPDNVDMTQIRRANVLALDGNGDIIYDTFQDPFLAPNGDPCFFANQDPVLVERKEETYAATNVRVINYDKVFRGFKKLSQGRQDQIVGILERGAWVGILTDPENNDRVMKRKRLRSV